MFNNIDVDVHGLLCFYFAKYYIDFSVFITEVEDNVLGIHFKEYYKLGHVQYAIQYYTVFQKLKMAFTLKLERKKEKCLNCKNIKKSVHVFANRSRGCK